MEVTQGVVRHPRLPALPGARQIVATSVLILVICGVNLWTLTTETLGIFHDDGIYAVVAKSLAEGDGHRIISLPTSPSQTKYPFAYSYLLSWIWKLTPTFPANVVWLKGLSVLFLLALLQFAYVLYCRHTNGNLVDGLVYIFLLGANPFVFSFTDYTLSDIPFAALALASVIVFDRATRDESRCGIVVLCGVVATLSYLTRAIGISLVFAGLAHFAMRRRRAEIVTYLTVCGACLAPWMIWTLLHRSGHPVSPLLGYYVGYETPAFISVWSNPSQAWQIVWGNILYCGESIDVAFLLYLAPALRFILYPIVIWGCCLFWRQTTVFGRAFLLSYLFLVISWPFHPHRYLLPLIPLLLLWLIQGVQAIGSKLPETFRWPGQQLVRFGDLLVRVPVAMLVAYTAVWLHFYSDGGDGRFTRGWYGRQLQYNWNGFVETFAWVRQHTEPDAVLGTAYDPMYFLYTGRKAVRPWFHQSETYFYPHHARQPYVGPATKLARELAALRVRYLIIDPLDGYSEEPAAQEVLGEMLRSYAQPATLLFVSSDGLHRVYRLPE